MKLSREKMIRLANLSIEAEKKAESIEPFVNSAPELSTWEAYEIQKIRNKIVSDSGKRIIGAKMGSTSLAKLAEFGVYSPPEYGRLFDYMQLKGNEALMIDELIHPKVEAELAFVTKKKLCGPNVTSSEALAATECIVAAIEIIDSRFHNFEFSDPDGEADNLSAARFKLGEVAISPNKLDLVTLGVKMNINDKYTGFGAAGAVLGHPARSLAKLANLLYENEMELDAGQIVLTGAIISSRKIFKGDMVRASFEDLGVIEMEVK